MEAETNGVRLKKYIDTIYIAIFTGSKRNTNGFRKQKTI
jgi:hypothetical protein